MSCQGWLRSSRVAQQPLLSRPCQGWSQGSGRRRLGTAKKLGHVIGVASVAVGTKLALAVTVGISVVFSKMDWVRDSSVTQKVTQLIDNLLFCCPVNRRTWGAACVAEIRGVSCLRVQGHCGPVLQGFVRLVLAHLRDGAFPASLR